MRYLFVNVVLLLSLLGGQNQSAFIPQSSIQFRNATVVSNYPDGITFRIEICGRPANSSVVFYYSTDLDMKQYGWWTKELWSLDEGQTADNCDKRKFTLQIKELDLPPLSPVRYYWSVVQGKNTSQSPRYIYFCKDGRYNWKSVKDANFVVWWHDRPDSFGQEVLSIADTASQDQSRFYSMSLDSPINVVIANSSDEFFAWQSEENYAGGLAYPELNLTVQLVDEQHNYQTWLDDVIPHEISHIYFGHLVDRYSGVPYWLNEGLATYQEYSQHYEEWQDVRNAYDQNHVLSLKDLEYTFGENEEDARLAYAESYYAVLYMEEFYGPQAVSTLFVEFKNGRTENYAFDKVFGRNAEDFEKDYKLWLEKRIETAPPNTSHQKALSASESNWLFAILVLLCSLPFLFVALGAGAVMILWKLISVSSKKDKSTVS